MSQRVPPNQQPPQPAPDPDPALELACEAFRYLNSPAGGPVQSLLTMCGFPERDTATLGELYEMLLNPECGFLEHDSPVRRMAGEWFSTLQALYRAHADSDAFLNSRKLRMVMFFSLPEDVEPTALPLSESKCAMLSMSSEIVEQLAATLATEESSSLARAIAETLRRPSEALTRLQDTAIQQRLRATGH